MNATTTFNEYDPKYMYWLHTFHVTTVTSIICIMGLIWYLLSILDVLFVKDFKSHRTLQTICNLLPIMFPSAVFALAFMGVMDSEPIYLYHASAFMLCFATGAGSSALFFLGACTPDSFLQRFCHYMYKKACEFGGKVYDEKDINDFNVLSLLQHGFTLIVYYCIYYMVNKCYQFYKDQPEYSQYPLL